MLIDMTSVTDAEQDTPLYVRVTQLLTLALKQESIPVGTVLLEGHIAELMRITRTPVRQALQALLQQGLVSKFEGRGVLAGPATSTPKRLNLTAEMLGLHELDPSVRKARSWETIYNEVEQDVVHLSIFDAFRLNELELARHFGVGRMAAREALQRLESLGLITKDERQRWNVIPLNRERMTHLYELRILLEPAALESAALHAPNELLQKMNQRLEQAMKRYPKLNRKTMDNLEIDLHVTLLSYCPNQPLLDSLKRTRSILTLSKHVLGAAAPMPTRDPFLSDHLQVIQYVANGDLAAAKEALIQHLTMSSAKAIERAEFVRKHMPTPTLPYAAPIATH
ncbi:GntR family transcriptional regulator [Alcaligenaceae bacterium 429]|nr:GntR family transcriptional regulator [Alcaligenaceae bacterium 429]